MKTFSMKNRKLSAGIQLFFIFIWMSVLTDSDSFRSVYVICCMAATLALSRNFSAEPILPAERTEGKSLILWSAVFSVAVALANYPVFLRIRNVEMIGHTRNVIINLLHLICTLIGGCFVAGNILKFCYDRFPRQTGASAENRKSGRKVFLLSFFLFSGIYLAYLFLLEYPSHISIDSLMQIQQAHTNAYEGMHPFWHTILIKLTMSVGYGLFSDINAAAACYSITQLLLTAACFAYVVMTLYQAGMPLWCVATAAGAYGFLPYNIALSITMWKDIPFSLGILLMITALYRYLRKIGTSEKANLAVLALGTALAGIMRTNGVLTIGIGVLAMLPALWKQHKKLLLVLGAVLLVCALLTGVVAPMFTMEAADYEILEPLSIPIQQIARVVCDGCALTEEQTALISKVIDVEQIPQYYQSWVVDPLKLELRKCDLTYFHEHKDQYFRLWVELGLEYPWEYLKAWVDQTKGYWNGGYDYYQYAEVMEDNLLGLEKAGGSDFLIRVKYLLFGLGRFSIPVEPLNSIGLHVWLLIACFAVNRRKKRPEWLLCVPGMVIIAGLIIGAPVYSEFRYAYPVFLGMPLTLAASMYDFHGKEG